MGATGASCLRGERLQIDPVFLRWQQEIWMKGPGSAGGSIPSQVSVVAPAFSGGLLKGLRLMGWKALWGCLQ